MDTVFQNITARDISEWETLDEVVDTFGYRGLEEVDIANQLSASDEETLGEASFRALKLSESQFILVILAEDNKTPIDYRGILDNNTRTCFVIKDFEQYTFITRKPSFGERTETTYQRYSFEKQQFTGDGRKYTVLDKLNDLKADDVTSIQNLYDTREVVKRFYDEFETHRTELIGKVTGLSSDVDKPGQAKARYVQTLFNRLIFLHFIQEKGLLNGNSDYLLEKHDNAAQEKNDVYSGFYEPLFFKVLAEEDQGADGDDEIDTSLISDDNLPYLNGGLFAKSSVENKNPRIQLGRTSEERNDNYRRILSFLDEWNWNVDERLDIVEPKYLSPEILGHIFEQTVNQKELGAYYTPEEITEYMAQRSIRPYLVDELNEHPSVTQQYDSLEQIFSLERDVETFYKDVLLETAILDPAVGSGAFLLAAEEVLVELYLRSIRTIKRTHTTDEYDQGSPLKTAVQLEPDQEELTVKRLIIQNNLYGVDIDDGAVQICKLRLWLSMVAQIENDPDRVEPLPNIDFNIRDGNSLIGFITDEENVLDDNTTLDDFGEGAVESYIDEVAGLIEDQEAASGARAVELREDVEDKMNTARDDLNERVKNEFEQAGLEEVTQEEINDHNPFHWVIEFAKVYQEGWFDVIIGNPPWDRIRPTRDEFYADRIESFRTLLPSEQQEKIDEVSKANPGLEEEYNRYEEQIHRLAEYFHNSNYYEFQDPKVDGRKRSTENDLSALFLERIYKLADESTYVAQILPGNIFTGLATKDLRQELMSSKTTESIIGFENNGIFQNIHQQYKFGIVVFKNSGNTDHLHGIFAQTDLRILRELKEGDSSRLLDIPASVLADYSPTAGTFPIVQTQEQVDVLKTIIQHPEANRRVDGSWYAQPYRELDRTNDSDRFIEESKEADYPVLGGRNIYSFQYDDSAFNIDPPRFWSVDDGSERSAKQRIREKQVRNLKSELYDFVGESAAVREQTGVTQSGSQKSVVNNLLEETRGEPLSEDDVKLDCEEHRIVYRDIAQPTDERTMIATVIPKGYVCHNKLHTVRPLEIDPDIEDLSNNTLHSTYKRIFTDKELFAAVGVLNSLAFDYLMRTKVDKSVVMYKFRESQLPHLTDDDEHFEDVWRRAARLNCYGDPFEDLASELGVSDEIVEPGSSDERREIQAQVDAAVFDAYGFDQEEVEFICDDFHRVSNARLMKEAYFKQVKEEFEGLNV